MDGLPLGHECLYLGSQGTNAAQNIGGWEWCLFLHQVCAWQELTSRVWGWQCFGAILLIPSYYTAGTGESNRSGSLSAGGTHSHRKIVAGSSCWPSGGTHRENAALLVVAAPDQRYMHPAGGASACVDQECEWGCLGFKSQYGPLLCNFWVK